MVYIRLNIRKHKFRTVAPIFQKAYSTDFGNLYQNSAYYKWAQHNRFLLRDWVRAKNITYKKLINFLKHVNIDRKKYVKNRFVCIDFTTKLHNNAEKHGIRCGVIFIKYKDVETPHCANVFHTTDKGLVYIDVCGARTRQNERQVMQLNLRIGEPVIEINLFENKKHECSTLEYFEISKEFRDSSIPNRMI